MPIVVTIIKTPESVNITESTKTFDEQGGSLGRGKDNAWVLDDPERFLSGCHCEITSENGQFYITDLSTNGTFFNGAVNPMGKGTKLPLADGNLFVLGDYEFSVSINAGSDPFASSMPATGKIPADDIFSAPLSANNPEQNDASPFAGGHVSSSDSLFSSTEETDPLAALDKAQGGSPGIAQDFSGGLSAMSSGAGASSIPPASDPFGDATHSDQADPLSQQVSWPNAVPEQTGGGGGIPDDWDDDLMSPASATPTPVQPSTPLTQPPVIPEPAQQIPAQQIPAQTPAQQAPVAQEPPVAGLVDTKDSEALLAQQQENKKLLLELKILKQKMQAQQLEAEKKGGQSDVSVDTRLIEAMGLNKNNLVDAEITQINQVVGEVVREMVIGLMQVLGSRSSIKNEFRMNVTTIQPAENNPLKFSANVDDALENMFIKQGNAYKKPVESVKEGFEGIAEHQVAILAGIRSAFKGVIERFDPVLLEQRFIRQKKSGIIPTSQKAKNWELYLEYYNELAGDIDNSFQYLFGDDFVKAYEDQLQTLVIARKTQNNKTSN